ncbi:MAG: ABC transporter permease, partial [Firmicutes bacterium]|nr:ABC transporter permease [Bacillota bacterium]
MDLRETVRIAWQELMANKLRSFLTLLGIIVGVGAVIGLLAVGNGAVAMLSGQFQAVGTNMVFIQWNWQEEDEVWKNLGEKDLVAIEKRADLVTNVTPYDQGYGPVRAGRETLFVNISGVGEDFPQVQGLKLARGRFFNAFEARTGKKVCVLGWDLHQKLFGKSDGIGKSIRVGAEKFTVLGVMEKKDERSLVQTGITDNMRLYLPIRTLKRGAAQKGYPLIMANPVEVRLTKAAVGQLKWI